LDESIDQATQLQVNIKQIADQFAPNTDDNEGTFYFLFNQSFSG
jgi:hypothetical protein